ncbi:hypothetical protein [Novipirellula artificiosorum]|uniref:Uncharacterized protein n=1 Tax=Novipirellula artificiosorum TaxID=2528016 RepID=A0A5C6DL24_9BACT|nr:hypothetical protein [Novipirellula artificiosorum]TWU37302.1 hypothetical protein Poly41_34310 [Novipirellula artificiosorum]
MNFLCHAIPYFDSPLVAAGTAVPDWLSVVDRKIRARRKHAVRFLENENRSLREVALGIVRHVEDDTWFHETQAFAETNMTFAVQLRDQLPGDSGFRPTFVGHILVEMLLDALWIRDQRAMADRYYQMLSDVSSETVQSAVNEITGKPTEKLAPVIDRFVQIRFLYDYLDNEKLLYRLNQVMNRVRLAPLPDSLLDWFDKARHLVESRRTELLTPPIGPSPFPLPS